MDTKSTQAKRAAMAPGKSGIQIEVHRGERVSEGLKIQLHAESVALRVLANANNHPQAQSAKKIHEECVGYIAEADSKSTIEKRMSALAIDGEVLILANLMTGLRTKTNEFKEENNNVTN